MNTLFNLIVVVQVLSALIIIGLVLLQHGKGADMGAAFGSGASGSLFGATGSSNFMSKSTGVAAAIFFASTLALAYFSTNRTAPTGGGVMERITVPATKAPATGGAAVPGTTTVAPAAPANAPANAAGNAPANPPSAAPAVPTPPVNQIPK
ncbi:MAG: preprotein translocase subunit SecG [Massilia sp.]|jgi:preprotein translocase subunit SecG|nr:preprotein translocase subunit SecG [Massilia sp.]